MKQLHYTMGASVSVFYVSTCTQVVALSERNKLDKNKAHKQLPAFDGGTINGTRAREPDSITDGNAFSPTAYFSAICNAIAAAMNMAPLVAQDCSVSRKGRRCVPSAAAKPRFAAASARLEPSASAA